MTEPTESEMTQRVADRAAGRWKRGFRLSPSAVELLHKCPREFNLQRVAGLLPDDTEQKSRATHFNYGHAIEAGVVSYLKTGNVEQAVFDAWMRYGDEAGVESETKCLEGIVAGIRQLALIWPHDEWQLAKSQIGFKITFDDLDEEHGIGGYYCGYIDASILNRYVNTIASLECKTTGWNTPNVDPMYQNTEQAIAYPTVLSYIHRANPKSTLSRYACLYAIFRVAKSWIPTIELKPYIKSKALMLEWLLGLRLSYDQLKQYIRYDYWPMYGHSCIKFGKACSYFGVCQLHAGLPDIELPPLEHGMTVAKPKEEEEFEHTIRFDDLFNWVRNLP